MITTDLIIIGAGPGGYETAVEAARRGLSVTVIEAGKTGGTCLVEGCIPTKCLHRNAEFLESLQTSETLGISLQSGRLDFEQVMKRKNEVVARLQEGVRALLQTPGIHMVEGKAYFVEPHTIGIEGSDEQYAAPHIIIATGSVTKMLPVPGMELPGVLTSTSILNLTQLPHSLCVIGGGVIGLEFASIFNAFGCKVTVVEYCKEILPNLDSALAKRLRLVLKQKGIEIITQAEVKSVEQLPDGNLGVNYLNKGRTLQCIAQNVLCAVGRAANTSSLNLADAGIHFTPRGITVDEHMQTHAKGIYAIGDVNGLCQLAHAATAQGKVALNHILGNESAGINLQIMPSVVFTLPEMASVGLSEDACKQQQIAYTAHKSFYRANGKALAMNEPEGMVKLITSADDGKILGCHLFGAHASDLIQEIVCLVHYGGTLTDLKQIIHAHPTLCELIADAAHA